MEMMIGNTRITFDTSYLDNRTEEQKKIDEAMLTDAIWNLYDAMDED
jgi:hypothetical protein